MAYIFQDAAKRLTLERKAIRILFKDRHACYAKIQTKCKSNHYKLRYRRVSFILLQQPMADIFKIAIKRLTLERKAIRTLFKDRHVCYAKIQTKYKSDQKKLRSDPCKLRYRGFS